MKNKQRGAAIVEFAFALPLLLILTLITTEFGRAIYQYNILAKSVRDAARFMSIQAPGDTTKYQMARNLVVYGKPVVTPTDTPLVIGLDASNANLLVPDPVWQPAGAAPVINTVTVRVTGYTFHPLLSSAFGVSFGPASGIPFAPISATMRGAL